MVTWLRGNSGTGLINKCYFSSKNVLDNLCNIDVAK